MDAQIDCSSVARFGKTQDRRFLHIHAEMQKSLADRSCGREVCLHEAAHAELMEQDGILNVRFVGPNILYNPYIDQFIASSAQAIGDDQPNAVVTDDYVFMIVCHMVAGGVVLRLNGKAETGDDGDFQDFKKRYAAYPPKSGESADAIWKRAQEVVAARLSEQQTKQGVNERAEKYFHLLYPGE